jgi:uridine monophosphate synthetase
LRDVNTLFCATALLPCCCLQKEQLKVTDVVVLIDREQGGAAHLEKHGLKLHAAFKLSAMLDVLQKHNLVDEALAGKVRAFIAENQTQLPAAAAAGAAAAAAPPAQPKR